MLFESRDFRTTIENLTVIAIFRAYLVTILNALIIIKPSFPWFFFSPFSPAVRKKEVSSIHKSFGKFLFNKAFYAVLCGQNDRKKKHILRKMKIIIAAIEGFLAADKHTFAWHYASIFCHCHFLISLSRESTYYACLDGIEICN